VIYPERLFHQLLAEGEPFVRLWLARAQGEIVSGALVLSWGEVSVYWHGATLESAFPLRPCHAVVMAAVEDAINRGCRWFDFSPSGGLKGVAQFKEGFGARPVQTAAWELSARPAARLAQRVIRHFRRLHSSHLTNC
jgi:lipid II:glycine glycyltransferase (peptidoglycan interpeptide bridge formation enzyme)